MTDHSEARDLTVKSEKKSEKKSRARQESVDSDDGPKRKKARTTFTGRQIFELEKKFEEKKYLSSSERAEMASLLNVTETQVCDRLDQTNIKQNLIRIN